MLVAHDAVKAHRIGEGVLLMVLIVEMMGLLRVKMGVRKTETARLVLLQVGVGDVAVGLLRKPVDFDVILRSGKLLDHTGLLGAIALLGYGSRIIPSQGRGKVRHHIHPPWRATPPWTSLCALPILLRDIASVYH